MVGTRIDAAAAGAKLDTYSVFCTRGFLWTLLCWINSAACWRAAASFACWTSCACCILWSSSCSWRWSSFSPSCEMRVKWPFILTWITSITEGTSCVHVTSSQIIYVAAAVWYSTSGASSFSIRSSVSIYINIPKDASSLTAVGSFLFVTIVNPASSEYYSSGHRLQITLYPRNYFSCFGG